MIERSVSVVFLEGDPGYYSRLGFAAGAEQGFREPSLLIPDAPRSGPSGSHTTSRG